MTKNCGSAILYLSANPIPLVILFSFFHIFFSSDVSLWRWIPKLVLAADYYTTTEGLYIFPSNFRFLLFFCTFPSIKMLFSDNSLQSFQVLSSEWE